MNRSSRPGQLPGLLSRDRPHLGLGRRVRTVPTWARRLLTVLALLPMGLLAQLGVALAGDSGNQLGQTPAALSWIKLTDSRGISVWNYELSLDRGGITAPGKVVWSFVIDFFWQLYRGGVVISIWFIDWALSFSWLPTIVTPVMALSDNLTRLKDRVGGVAALLTVAAVVAVCWMMRGKWALGVFELFTSLLIASLATGALASPVAMVAGPSGALMSSRSLGLEIADGLATDGGSSGATSSDVLRQQTTARLVDTFVRLPLETLNFGTVLDGGKCDGAYSKVIKGGPYGMGDDIRNAVGDCDSDLGDVAGNPGSGQALSAAIISPAAALVLVFATVLAGTVFLAALGALYQGLRLIVTLVSGLLPGEARGVLWITVADLVMSLVTLVFAIVFLTGYLLLVASVFTSTTPGQSPMQTFFFVDVLLVAALLIFWRGRASIQRASAKLAKALATRPGGGTATALPQKRPFNAADAYYTAKMAAGAAGGVKAAAGAAGALAGPAHKLGAAYAGGRDRAYGGLRGAALGAGVDLRAAGSWLRWAASDSGAAAGSGARPHRGGGPALPPSPPRALPPGGGDPDEPQPSPAGGPRSPSGAPLRLTALVEGRKPPSGRGRLMRTAGQLALAAGTGGTSAALVATGRAAGRAAAGCAARSALAGVLPSRPPSAPGPLVSLTKRASPGAGGARVGTGPGRPQPGGRAAVPAAAALAGAGRVVDQDGRELPDVGVRLQERLQARGRRVGVRG